MSSPEHFRDIESKEKMREKMIHLLLQWPVEEREYFYKTVVKAWHDEKPRRME